MAVSSFDYSLTDVDLPLPNYRQVLMNFPDGCVTRANSTISGQPTTTVQLGNVVPTSKGAILVGDGTAATSLVAGSNDTSLIADSTQTAGVRWDNVDHTTLKNKGTNTHAQLDAFVASKAAVNGLASLDGSSFVPTAQLGNVTNTTAIGNINFSLGQVTPTAKGSFIVGNGSNPAVESVGTDGQALLADSTQTTGLRWGGVAALDSLSQMPLVQLNRSYKPTLYGTWTSPNVITPFEGNARDNIVASGNVLGQNINYDAFRTFQIATGATYRMINRVIFVEWLNLNGTLACAGPAGSAGNVNSGAGGGAVASNGFGGGTSGGAGGTAAGSNATGMPGNSYIGSAFFNGGGGGLGSSGAGGGGASVTGADYSWTRPPYCYTLTNSSGGMIYSGGGGGGGGGDGTNRGGGGGAGGGTIFIYANRITGTGTIDVSGGNGGAGVAGNAGGGGGGGGGMIVIHTNQDPATIQLTFKVNGGTGGAKSGTGVAGTNGTTGAVAIFSGWNQSAWLSS